MRRWAGECPGGSGCAAARVPRTEARFSTDVYSISDIHQYKRIQMDPIKNPFSPGAGSPPPELVGRDPILEQARILLGRGKEKRAEKSMLLTGLRGVGKTVLLNEIERMAENEGYRTIAIEAHEDKALGPLI